MTKEEFFMRRAMRLAERGRGFVSPNPMVGACLVQKGVLIAEGYHACFGGSHAELDAIQKAGKKARGATLYVTLEPCSTYGKTPPCTEAIRNAGIKKVAIGAIDPNPKHKGKGIRILKKYGIEVQAGVLREEVSMQNEAFFKWIKTGLPFVTLKMAQTLDGKIATKNGSSRWISGSGARDWVHQLRSTHDAVLVGKNTVLLDDPRLTVRNTGPVRQPWRIVLDQKGSLSPQRRLFKQGGPVALVCSEKYMAHTLKKFSSFGVSIVYSRERKGRFDLKELLQKLGSLGIASLLIEGGGETAWSFLESRLVDRVKWIVAPKIVGGREAETSVEGDGIGELSKAFQVRNLKATPIGTDFLFEGDIN
jgi:diaminohydroxyphosphoribosylaminopyrimidine deaminase/5-amino-6-(5-phosphoribosylamino)uracil reductase